MKSRVASVLFGGSLLAATGCLHHPPYNGIHSPVPPMAKITHRNTLPPAQMLMEPGPGVGGPGPGVMMAGGGMAGIGGGGACGVGVSSTSQVHFKSPEGMQVQWDVSSPGMFDSDPLMTPARYNFPQGAIYRLKLTSIPGRPGVELYPTIEIGPSTPRTEAYLAHNMIPMELSEEDLDQILSGNFVTKVIYLPDPEHQELALAGIETLVSTRLDPGVDPIVEADRKGSILAIIRVGNKDLELPSGDGESGDVIQAGYFAGAACGPAGGCGPGGEPAGMPPAFVAGVTAPQYGMPISGTPIGLPGPPHIPLGAPAGLQQHVMKNNTRVHIPGPVKKFRIDVKQTPGLSYPKPVSHMSIHEHAHVPPVIFRQPLGDHYEHANDNPEAGYNCYDDGGACE